MGLFSFVADKGAQLFGMKTEAQENGEKAQMVMDFVGKMGFSVSSFSAMIEDETATLMGEAETGEIREKIILSVGNIEGIATVNDQMTVKMMTPEARFYTVKGGDSLSKIAKEFYGDPMKYNDIFKANMPMLADPEKIYPGQTLRIPEMNA